MPKAEHELGHASTIKAEALGVPGQRRFRVLIEAEGGKACAWVEKAELQELALTIQELLASEETKRQEPRGTPSPAHTQRQADLEFQVGRLALGYDQEQDWFVLDLSDQSMRRGRVLVRVFIGRALIGRFAKEATGACAAGRPLCPLCEAPLGPEQHVCPRANGHFSL
ncbi:MAG: DUF3090 family protein [Dehalococcoidia bacterium]|nr:DUF3090 family protein [Dehalococcoidia bacterium]